MDLPCGGEVVLRSINDTLLEHASRLLSDSHAQVAIRFDIGSVASIAWDCHRFARNRGLYKEVN